MTGEESLSIERRGKWCWKYYKPLDPTGRWPGEHFWMRQLSARAEVRHPIINPVRRWFAAQRIAVSRWVEPVRPTTAEDAAELRKVLPKWIGDVTLRNVIVGENGPKLIDFCVNHV